MKTSKYLSLSMAIWLPTAITITLLSALAYLGVQQVYRQNANDPQIQMTQEAAKELSQLEDLNSLAGTLGNMDIYNTLNAFIVIYDESGKPIAGNGFINDQLPSLPGGVFSEAKKKSDHRFTWAPTQNDRYSAVLKSFSGKQNGFMLAGRSLRLVEERTKNFALILAVTWGAAMLLSFAMSFISVRILRKQFASHSHEHSSI
ncbi:MAG: hypothetical protein JNN11_01760 [Candidatus Doudnabacteria bacterium]|nr:hypothetical protein [Candidatus Doudnabacteria bacterium]